MVPSASKSKGSPIKSVGGVTGALGELNIGTGAEGGIIGDETGIGGGGEELA